MKNSQIVLIAILLPLVGVALACATPALPFIIWLTIDKQRCAHRERLALLSEDIEIARMKHEERMKVLNESERVKL